MLLCRSSCVFLHKLVTSNPLICSSEALAAAHASLSALTLTLEERKAANAGLQSRLDVTIDEHAKEKAILMEKTHGLDAELVSVANELSERNAALVRSQTSLQAALSRVCGVINLLCILIIIHQLMLPFVQQSALEEELAVSTSSIQSLQAAAQASEARLQSELASLRQRLRRTSDAPQSGMSDNEDLRAQRMEAQAKLDAAAVLAAEREQQLEAERGKAIVALTEEVPESALCLFSIGLGCTSMDVWFCRPRV